MVKDKKIVSESTLELKANLELKDSFADKRYKEQVELTTLRHKLAMQLLKFKDEVASKRHKERVNLLKKKFE